MNQSKKRRRLTRPPTASVYSATPDLPKAPPDHIVSMDIATSGRIRQKKLTLPVVAEDTGVLSGSEPPLVYEDWEAQFFQGIQEPEILEALEAEYHDSSQDNARIVEAVSKVHTTHFNSLYRKF